MPKGKITDAVKNGKILEEHKGPSETTEEQAIFLGFSSKIYHFKL